MAYAHWQNDNYDLIPSVIVTVIISMISEQTNYVLITKIYFLYVGV
jgi:cytochrome c oxidase subunit IV